MSTSNGLGPEYAPTRHQDSIEQRIEADRANRPHRLTLNWCSEHDCRLGTCFEVHNPTAFGLPAEK